MIVDCIAVLDWSAAKGPRLGRDSIWLSLHGQESASAINLPTRQIAEQYLTDVIGQSIAKGERLLLGADFAFGAPTGFIRPLTGAADARSWWAWLAEHVTESSRNESNYRQVAARMNGFFPGEGPFWGNNEKLPTPGLPRLKPPLPDGLLLHRQTDLMARTAKAQPKPVWQLAGAGAVGAQVLTGLPVLHRLRQRFAGQIGVWPFDPPTFPVTFAEVYPSLLSEHVRHICQTTGIVPDQAQVQLLAAALWRIGPDGRAALFDNVTAPPEEGWILGAGRDAILGAALR